MFYVLKRNGERQDIHFDKITYRIAKLINPIELQRLNLPHLEFEKEVKFLNPVIVAQKTISSIYSGITTEELDIQSSEICVNLSTTHPSYASLGGRIMISNLHKKTRNSFVEKIRLLSESTELIDPSYVEWIFRNAEQLNSMVDYDRDYLYDYFGYKTLEKAYLLKLNGKIIERPQDMLMRTAIMVQKHNGSIYCLEMIKRTYDMMSLGYYTHASPTLFNSLSKHRQLSSCFLLGTNDDLTDIATTWNSCAQISKWAGGIGLHVSNIRGKDSLIKGTGGRSNGLVPFLRVFNDIARWIDQGGKRPGSIAIYLEPHHPDIFEFLELRKNFGSETERARDLFLALWVSDLFMKQVEVDGDWYLLSPDNCPGLTDAFGSNYEILYWQYVNEGKFKSKVKARKLWLAILDSQIETGMPYISYKDAVNKKSNQKNIGTIKSSNLCNEIVQYSDHKEYAVCNLASIALKSFIIPFDFEMTREWIVYSKPNCKYCRYAKSYLDSNNVHFTEVEFSNDSLLKLKEILHTQKVTFPQIFTRKDAEDLVHIGGWSDLYKHTGGQFNYQKLYDIAYLATVNLNQVIDVNYYPVPETRFSNMRHRPIGLGIQGLADSLALMRIPFDSDDAVQYNSKMMETIYLASVTASNDLAIGRMEGMGRLIECFRVSMKQYPEFYDDSFVLDSVDMNELYHSLKPCKYELDRDPNLTTIGSYSTFDGSPFSEGKFQFDLWEKPEEELMYPDDWRKLREKVIIFGTRNSLLTALMPTASTSQILGNNECFEFFTNNIYTRKTQAGDFILVNKYLVKDLISIGLWSDNMKNLIIANDGSIQAIEDIPPEIRTIYKTMWELKQLWVMKGAVARGPFVDQTQSMNIFMGEPDYQRLTSSHFYGWKNGLKTGMYYLRSKPSANATKFTIDPNLIKNKEQGCINETKQEEVEACLSCSG